MTEVSQSGAGLGSPESQRKGGLGDRFRGLAQDELPLLTAPLVASLVETLSLGDALWRGKNSVDVLLGGRAYSMSLALVFFK